MTVNLRLLFCPGLRVRRENARFADWWNNVYFFTRNLWVFPMGAFPCAIKKPDGEAAAAMVILILTADCFMFRWSYWIMWWCMSWLTEGIWITLRNSGGKWNVICRIIGSGGQAWNITELSKEGLVIFIS